MLVSEEDRNNIRPVLVDFIDWLGHVGLQRILQTVTETDTHTVAYIYTTYVYASM